MDNPYMHAINECIKVICYLCTCYTNIQAKGYTRKQFIKVTPHKMRGTYEVTWNITFYLNMMQLTD
jgi:hypothetical protein